MGTSPEKEIYKPNFVTERKSLLTGGQTQRRAAKLSNNGTLAAVLCHASTRRAAITSTAYRVAIKLNSTSAFSCILTARRGFRPKGTAGRNTVHVVPCKRHVYGSTAVAGNDTLTALLHHFEFLNGVRSDSSSAALFLDIDSSHWIFHFRSLNLELGFVISNPKNLRVPIGKFPNRFLHSAEAPRLSELRRSRR